MLTKYICTQCLLLWPYRSVCISPTTGRRTKISKSTQLVLPRSPGGSCFFQPAYYRIALLRGRSKLDPDSACRDCCRELTYISFAGIRKSSSETDSARN